MINHKLIEIIEQMYAEDHNILYLMDIRSKLIEYLCQEENLLSDCGNRNVILAKDTIRVIDALNIYIVQPEMGLASEKIQPFFDKLLEKKSWDYYDVKLVASSITLTVDVELAIKLGNMAIVPITEARIAGDTSFIHALLACNICSRILHGKYLEEKTTVDLDEKFMTWFKISERLAEDDFNLRMLFLVNQIRYAVYYQKRDLLFKLCQDVEKECSPHVSKTILSKVSFYTSTRKYNADLYEGIRE